MIIEDEFNDWLSKKLVVIVDEAVTPQELRHHKVRLKALLMPRRRRHLAKRFARRR